jgi:hypothetical protein
MSDHNYYMDPRVLAGQRDTGIVDVDEERMVATLRLPDEEDGYDEFEIHCEYAVCGTCGGRGKHVNPSIDCNGLTREDFDADPDFYEDYRSGFYDVSCYECKGRRVVPSLTPQTARERAAMLRWEKWAQEEERYLRMCAAERAMGA